MLQSEPELDRVDEQILGIVRRAARTPNSEIAAAVGIAQSTAHARLRALEARGVVAGYEAVVDQRELGRSIQALIGVTLRPGARQSHITTFAEDTRALPEVTQMFFVGGLDDFIIHIAVEDSSALRRFVVDHLSGHASVASTRTSIIFEYSRNGVTAPFA
jgi:DNA-binding Lrp family transcriptional regulator